MLSHIVFLSVCGRLGDIQCAKLQLSGGKYHLAANLKVQDNVDFVCRDN